MFEDIFEEAFANMGQKKSNKRQNQYIKQDLTIKIDLTFK
jgi:hypothetical protein